MNDALRQALKNCEEEKKKEAAHLLWQHHGWTIAEISQVVNRPVIWVIQILESFGIKIEK